MNGVNFEAIGLAVIGLVVTATKDQVNNGVDHLAAEIIKATKSTETALDDTVVRDILAPAVERLGVKLREGLAA